MKSKISKAQVEVWDWKVQLYEEIKKLPADERIIFIKKKAEKKISEILRERHSKTLKV